MTPGGGVSVSLVAALSAALLAATALSAQREPASPVATGAAPKTLIAYEDVHEIWSRLRPDAPSELTGAPAEALAATWSRWVRGQDAAVRDRVAQGDLDSLVHLWLFGTSFTIHPPARARDVDAGGGTLTVSEVAERRLADLLAALTEADANERLRWAVEFFVRQGALPGTPAGDVRIRELLAAAWRRMLAENADYREALEAPNTGADVFSRMRPYASLYQDRGLSSDTSILSSYSIDSALEALKASGMIGTTPIRRVAVVGPGLDFLNKADGHDFYAEQTIQPFAVVDSLVRLGLSRADQLTVTTFDVSAKVNDHLAMARERAQAGEGYMIEFPLSDTERWTAGVLDYWGRAGNQVGDPVPPSPVPPSAGALRVRAVKVRPDVVLSIVPRDLNIVVERLALTPDERFDLVVATNVFIYYDQFQQTLGVVNIGRMLRAGGSLLTNQALDPVPPMRPAVGHDVVAYSDRQFDPLFWYVLD